MIESITVHTMTCADGVEVKYARVLSKYGQTIVGQSVLLHRLSEELLRLARDGNDPNGKQPPFSPPPAPR